LNPSPREFRVRAFPLVETDLSPGHSLYPKSFIFFGREIERFVAIAFPVAHERMNFFDVKVFTFGHQLFSGSDLHSIFAVTFHVDPAGFEPRNLHLARVLLYRWSYGPKSG
jgi:hypothetical protein